MAKWVAASVLDNGINQIKNNATRMCLIKAYAAADSYATVAGNIIAEAAMTSTDYTLSSVGNDRRATTATKSIAASASSGASPNLHVAFIDAATNVLWVTDETSDQVVTSGNTVNFPALTYTSAQPT
jgi:hypothetical protein